MVPTLGVWERGDPYQVLLELEALDEQELERAMRCGANAETSN
ncbi:MAG: hypothetical protein ACE5IY_13640 [bacterium]